MDFSTVFMISYILIGIVVFIVQIYLFYKGKKNKKSYTKISVLLTIFLFLLSYYSSEIATVTHKFVTLNFPLQKDLLVLTKMDKKTYILLGFSGNKIELVEAEVNEETKSVKILIDAKTQYPSACNTTETLLVHERAVTKLLPELNKAFVAAGIKVYADNDILSYFDNANLANDESFHTEYLEKTINVKPVKSIDEAIVHINTYGSHHTDAILTNIDSNADYFMNRVDSANVYKNCSTRFADGFRYGFGAEVGISTGKLHARGPVGLEGLCTYKYKLYGNGDIVADYAEGKKEFHFKDL